MAVLQQIMVTRHRLHPQMATLLVQEEEHWLTTVCVVTMPALAAHNAQQLTCLRITTIQNVLPSTSNPEA